jgi:cytochrome c553
MYIRLLNKIRVGGILSIALLTNSAFVEAADAPSAKKLYKQICASCHGAKAKGNDALGSPALAGQGAEYLKRQLTNFSTGLRGADRKDSFGGQMVEMAKLLKSDEQQDAMADFLASLPPAKSTPSKGDVNNGSKYYQSCGSCHGAKAEGNGALNAPRLAGLSEDYLRRQHNSFIVGFRGSNKADRYGRQMAIMAATINDEKILTDIIAYITSLSD